MVKLLCEVCLREKEGLQDKQLKDIYHKLQKIEKDYEKEGCVGKSSDYKKAKDKKENQRYLVVWEHDWPECPLEVIELRPAKRI